MFNPYYPTDRGEAYMSVPEVFQNRGYQAMLKLYMELDPSIYEPPYTAPASQGGRDPGV